MSRNRHEAPDEHPIREAVENLLHHQGHVGDPGHLLPDDEWARVIADAHTHPDNPNHPGGQP